jgi:nucleoside-diphosphate-sugar epimerase
VIAVTGATGFVGRNVVGHLSKTEKLFIGLARPTASKHRSLEPGHILRGNLDSWLRTISTEVPETLILCDWNGVEAKFRDDNSQLENIRRWKEIAELAVSVGVKKIVALGSQAEIGTVQDNIDESVSIEPRSNYGYAKVEALKLLTNITSNSGCELVWARLFSVYGETMSENWFISKLVKAIFEDQALETSALTQIWNLLYIEDCASALFALSEKGTSGIYNVASEKSLRLLDLVDLVCSLMKKESRLKIGAIPFRPDETLLMKPRIDKLKSLGWVEGVLLEEGIKRVVEFKLRTL